MTKSSGFFVGFISTALVLSLALFVFTGDSPTVHAVPSLPHIFLGQVTVNGENPGSGAVIQARINNVNYAQSIRDGARTRTTTTESDGTFGTVQIFQVCGDTSDTSALEGGITGDIIEFYVNNRLATAHDPISGAAIDAVVFVEGKVTNLNLVVDGGSFVGETANSDACSIGDEVSTPTPAPTATTPPFIPPPSEPPTKTPKPSAPAPPTETPVATATPAPTATPIPTDVTTEGLETIIADLAPDEIAVALKTLLEDNPDVVVQAILKLAEEDADNTAEILRNLATEEVAAILSSDILDADTAAAVLGSGNLSADKVAEILQDESLDADRAASILSSDQIAVGKAAEILNSDAIDADKSAEILNSDSIDADKGAAILASENLDAEKGAELLGSDNIDAQKAADILDSSEIDATKAAEIVDQPALTSEKAADILGEVEKVKAGAILEGVSNLKVEGVVENMPEEKLIERLPEMSAEKLHTLNPKVLFDNLPSVPTEAITHEFVPDVDPGCTPPVVTQVSASLAVYVVCETGVLAWASLVGSPAPIDSILGKFTTVRSGISVGIEDIESLPAAAPQFASDRIINSFFNINIAGAEQGDLAAIHTTMFVEKSWIEANNIHKWSIAFNRFDTELGAWVPVTAKRVREDEERIYYTGVLPGFSTFAITGGTAPVVPQFTVVEASDRPFIQVNGAQATVSAEITNNGSDLLLYVANLWINDTIDRTQSIRVEAGQTKSFEFDIPAQDPGDYDIRVERVLGSYKIAAPVRILLPEDRPVVVVDGNNVTIAAGIQNLGNQTIGFEVVLEIDGVLEQTGTVEIPPGETAQFVFQDIIRDEPGTYQFVIGGLALIALTGEFTIQVPTPTPVPPTPVPPTVVPPTPVPPTPVPPTVVPPTPTATPSPTATPTAIPTATPTITPTATLVPPTPVPPTPVPPTPVPTTTPIPPPVDEGGVSAVLIILIVIIVILIIVGAVYFYLYSQDELPPWLPPWMPGAPGSGRDPGLGPPIDPFGPPSDSPDDDSSGDDSSGDDDGDQRPSV